MSATSAIIAATASEIVSIRKVNQCTSSLNEMEFWLVNVICLFKLRPITWNFVFFHHLRIGLVVNVVDLCNFDQISIGKKYYFV